LILGLSPEPTCVHDQHWGVDTSRVIHTSVSRELYGMEGFAEPR